MPKIYYFFLGQIVKNLIQFIIAFLLISWGLFLIFQFAGESLNNEFTCDRNSGFCEFKTSDMFGNVKQIERFNIDDVINMEVKTIDVKTRLGNITPVDYHYIITRYKKIAVLPSQYDNFEKFYDEDLDKIYVREPSGFQYMPIIVFLTFIFIGMVVFICTCKNILKDYSEKFNS